MEQLLNKLLDKLLDKINDPYVIACIFIIYAIVWLIPKAKEVGEWKGLFSKDRAEEMRQACELLKDSEEEVAFYEEAMRQEMFYNLIGIRCRKEYRETCQRLVIDGIASTEAIRLAYLFIYKSNSKIEVRIGVSDWANALFLIFIGFLGVVNMNRFFFDLLHNLNLYTGPSKLLGLSVAILFFFGALKGLLPMAAALGIRKRLRKLEEQNEEHAASPQENIDAAIEQNTQNANPD